MLYVLDRTISTDYLELRVGTYKGKGKRGKEDLPPTNLNVNGDQEQKPLVAVHSLQAC